MSDYDRHRPLDGEQRATNEKPINGRPRPALTPVVGAVILVVIFLAVIAVTLIL